MEKSPSMQKDRTWSSNEKWLSKMTLGFLVAVVASCDVDGESMVRLLCAAAGWGRPHCKHGADRERHFNANIDTVIDSWIWFSAPVVYLSRRLHGFVSWPFGSALLLTNRWVEWSCILGCCTIYGISFWRWLSGRLLADSALGASDTRVSGCSSTGASKLVIDGLLKAAQTELLAFSNLEFGGDR